MIENNNPLFSYNTSASKAHKFNKNGEQFNKAMHYAIWQWVLKTGIHLLNCVNSVIEYWLKTLHSYD